MCCGVFIRMKFVKIVAKHLADIRSAWLNFSFVLFCLAAYLALI